MTRTTKASPPRFDEDLPAAPLTDTDLRLVDAYWRAANYLSVGQVYLLANPLLREPLRSEHVKPRLLGHFGTTPGLNLIYVHLNRAIRARDLNAIYITGPGHGGPAVVANAYLEGTYSELYPHVTEDEDGLRELFRQFSFPGGIPSHAAPETPGSIHEGWRARLRARARTRRRLRQPGSPRRLRRRGWRGRNGPARDQLARQQVPEPGDRRRCPPDPPPERLQDRQSDGAGADPGARAGLAVRGLRLPSDPRHRRVRRRAGRAGASTACRCARRRSRRHRAYPARSQGGGDRGHAHLAHADPTDTEGVDGPARGGRRPGRKHMALAPGPDHRCARERRARRASGAMDAELPAGGAFRRKRAARSRARRSRSHGRPQDEREPARKRGRPPTGAPLTRLPLVCGRGRIAGHDDERGDARARRVPPRRHGEEPRRTSVSSDRTRRPRTGSAPFSRRPRARGKSAWSRRTRI